MKKSDELLEDLVRGALLNGLKSPELAGCSDHGIDVLSSSGLCDYTISGLEDGSILPVSEDGFVEKFWDAVNTGELAFFKKLRRRLKKVHKRFSPISLVKKAAKKLKPHLGKIAAVAAIGAAAYYGGPMLKPLMAKAKTFVTAKAKKLFMKKALVNAIKQKAGKAVINKLKSAYLQSSRQEQQQRAAAAAQGELDQLTARESAELNMAMAEDPVIVPRSVSRDRARVMATDMLAKDGIRMASPQAQQYLDQKIKEVQEEKGIGADPKPFWKKKAFIISAGVGGTLLVGGIVYAISR